MSEIVYRKLSPKCKSSMYVKHAISLIILAAIMMATYSLSSDFEYQNELTFAMAAIFVICTIYCVIGPIIFYRRYKYILTEDKVDTRRGIIIIRHTLVPIERIHQVEVVSGPINHMFGLADVNITTAGGMAKIEFLENDEADRIAKELNNVVNKILKDRIEDE